MEKQKYVEERKKLIPEAERYANSVVGTSRGNRESEQYAAEWNKAFHSKMNELWNEKTKLL